ncbi:hypothetical protein ACRAWD_27120 [Caulobacter segnis]
MFTQVGFGQCRGLQHAGVRSLPRQRRDRAGQGQRPIGSPSFTYGLTLPGLGQVGEYKTLSDIAPLKALPAATAPALRPLPPISEWTNVKTLGAKGRRGDRPATTAALQKAIDTHRVLYLPTGFYVVSDTP